MSTEGAAEWRASRDAHRQAQANLRLSDPEFIDKHNEIAGNIASLQTKLSSLDPSTTEYSQTQQSLQDAIQSRNDLFHPANNPGALAKFGHLLHIGKSPQTQSITTQSTPGTLPPQDGASTPIAATPAYQSATAGDPGVASGATQIHATTEPGLPETSIPNLGTGTAPVLPKDAPVTVHGPAVDPARLRAEAESRRKAQIEAGQMISAMPLSAQKQAELAAQTQVASQNIAREANLKWLKDHHASPEAIQQAAETMGGVPVPKPPKALGSPYKDERDGKYYQRFEDATTGEEIVREVPGYSQTARPSSSLINEALASYAHAHNTTIDKLPPAAFEYVKRGLALAGAMPSSTETTTLKLNAEGQFVPVTEHNSRTPGGPIGPDPLGPPSSTSATPSSPAHPVSGDSKPTPQSLRKEAAARAPKAASPTSSGGSAGGGGRTKVGDPLFAGPNKEYNDAKTAYHGAIERVKTMDKNLKSALNSNPPDQQAMLSLIANHIGMTLGAQKGARINQAVWNEAVSSAPWVETEYAKMFHTDPTTGDHIFDGWKSGVTLTPGQMKQMVELAHERKDTLEESIKTIEEGLNRGVSHPIKSAVSEGGDKDIDDIVKALSGGKKQ